jgi:DamX protein
MMDNKPETAGLAAQIDTLSDALARQRLEFQEAETSLVARIADVDDDRRLTTNRLQRAWQTQREEIETRLGRQASMFAGGLLLLAILLGVALVFTYGQLDAGRRALLEDVAQLRTDHHQLASSAIQGTDLQDELSSLRASVSAISKRLEHAEEQPPATLDAVLQAELSGLRASIAAVSARLERAEEQTNAQASAPPGAENAALPRELEPESDSLSTNILPDPATADPAQRVERPDIEPEPAPPADPAPDVVPESIPEWSPQIDDDAPGPTQPEAAPPPVPDQPTEELRSAYAAEADLAAAEPDIEPVHEVRDEEKLGAIEARVQVSDEVLVAGDQPYALQLIGFYTLDDMLDFARREELPHRVYFREESFQGRPWFVLIHSLHTDYVGASSANARLPSSLAMPDTWIRSLSPETRLGILDIER